METTSANNCQKCRWLKKYTSNDKISWMYICEAEDPQEGEDNGIYLVAAISLEEFDASNCLNFKIIGS